jgi:hypothetical protein
MLKIILMKIIKFDLKFVFFFIFNNKLFEYFIVKNKLKQVRYLKETFNIDPSRSDDWAINFASSHGFSDIVKYLLTDNRVNPSNDTNYPIRKSSENGHLDVVKLLMKDNRVNPSDCYNQAILQASINNQFNVIDELLNDSRVDPSMNNSIVFVNCARNGKIKLIERLLTYYCVDPSTSQQEALITAIENNHLNIVEMFYNNPNFHFSMNKTKIIEMALCSDSIEMVAYLLSLEDISIENYDLTKLIYPNNLKKNNIYEMSKLLLNYNKCSFKKIPQYYRYNIHSNTCITECYEKNPKLLTLLLKNNEFVSIINKDTEDWQLIKPLLTKNKLDNF